MPPILIPPPTITGKHLTTQFEELLQLTDDVSPGESLRELRKLILVEGLPPESELERNRGGDVCTLRGRVWRILLCVSRTNPEFYLSLIAKGRPRLYDKIRNDTFRTFPNDRDFRRRVPEEKLLRVLNAMEHACESEGGSLLSYVQGMNVLCAPFLYTMPEVEAFSCFHQFVHERCPTYMLPRLAGVTVGCELLDEVLDVVDAPLAAHLRAKGLKAQIYGFASILSLSACTPPLVELLKLWDLMMAFGVHMNVLFVAAQVVLLRNELLNSPSPMSLLRVLPRLNSHRIISLAIPFLRELPDDLYTRLVHHPMKLPRTPSS
eukprot:TRINITY_DN15187_c0_g1::TRINITY_DN15187_c0_g1_i1::g.30686::m.30686 TRINITY_DN15187_c0_g1::TRINITY_DN15187_c0_g1_i1::g.30686  ORF type:complete len:320 (-),score=7.17,sp/Q55EP9/BUB2_DICDI/45.55/9e-78,RabGAP-TBC/PF00566.13/4.5e-36 TRINITY_DN15187_c0_g1_i1:39-998(-)